MSTRASFLKIFRIKMQPSQPRSALAETSLHDVQFHIFSVVKSYSTTRSCRSKQNGQPTFSTTHQQASIRASVIFIASRRTYTDLDTYHRAPTNVGSGNCAEQRGCKNRRGKAEAVIPSAPLLRGCHAKPFWIYRYAQHQKLLIGVWRPHQFLYPIKKSKLSEPR